MCMVKTNTNDLASSKVRSDGLQTPGAAASPPTVISSACLITDCVLPCCKVALLSAAQAFSCAVAFELGHEAGCASALLLGLHTEACGSLGMATAMWRPVACRACGDRADRRLPARMWPTGRHRGS